MSQDNKYLYERLDTLQGLMERNADNPQFLKQLNREYKNITKQLFPKTKEHEISSKVIKESRNKALEQIKNYLDVDDIEGQFDSRDDDYYSLNKFIVSWNCNYNGFPHEISIDIVDSFYKAYSGAKCIVARRSLVSEKQLKAYGSFERALVEQGLKLCATQNEKKEFFDKYAVAYNNRLKQR